MTVVPEHSLDKIQTLGQIEQSVSIDSRVSRKKQQEQHKHKKRRHQPTIEEQLEEEEQLRNNLDEKDTHIDFHA